MLESSEYRDCPKCGKSVKVDATLCGHCWIKLPSEGVTGTPRASDLSVPSSYSDLATLTVRYRDAYVVAALTIGLGTVVKAIGLVLAAVVLLMSLGAADEFGGRVIIGGLLLGAWMGGTIYLLGITVSAQGQILQANLDTAVNTSPFLDNEHRIRLIRKG